MQDELDRIENDGHSESLPSAAQLYPFGQGLEFWLYILVFFLIALTLLSFFGTMVWWSDLISHFRLHIAVFISMILAVQVVVAKSPVWRLLVMGISAIVVSLTSIFVQGASVYSDIGLPSRMTREPPVITDLSGLPQSEIKILSLNVNAWNSSPDKVVAWVKKTEPDIAVLVEVNRNWQPFLDELTHLFPYQIVVDSSTNFGMALLSGFPLVNRKTDVAGLLSIPILSGEAETPFGRICIVGVHAHPPLSAETTADRNLYLNQVSAMVRTRGLPCVIAGDFNATPWSTGFETLRTLPNLQPELWQTPASWPSQLGILGLPVDHILLTSPIGAPEHAIMTSVYSDSANLGTDHRPIVAIIRSQHR